MKFDPSMIALHHIGARGGTGTAQIPPAFGSDMHFVYYEADANCIEQIAASCAESAHIQVLPLCVGEHTGRSKFHLDYDPFMSSLLELNPDYDAYTLFLIDPLKGAMDYCFGDTGCAVEVRDLDVVSLDSLFDRPSAPAPAPDFLSMDTQGSEYEILKGALRTLESSVLGLRLEVAFRPIYKGQKLFGDLCQLLADYGFQFVKMLEVFEMYPSRDPVGLRAGCFDAFGEALFFRTNAALQSEKNPEVRYLKTLKMAFLALLHGQLGYALGCLRHLGSPPKALAESLAQRAYPAFLTQLAQRAAAHPRTFPPLFSECYSISESMARFDGNFPTMEDRFHEILSQLRRDVAHLGGKRLCLMPFGFYARTMMTEDATPGMVPLAYFDNAYNKHQIEGSPVEDPEQIEGEDYVVILSQSYGAEMEKQLNRIRGTRPERTLSYKDLIAGRWTFAAPTQQTEVEQWLSQHGFEALAKNVRELRLTQTRSAPPRKPTTTS